MKSFSLHITISYVDISGRRHQSLYSCRRSGYAKRIHPWRLTHILTPRNSVKETGSQLGKWRTAPAFHKRCYAPQEPDGYRRSVARSPDTGSGLRFGDYFLTRLFAALTAVGTIRLTLLRLLHDTDASV